MKTLLQRLFVLSAIVISSAGCKIDSPDFFVPDVNIPFKAEGIAFDKDGGSKQVDVEANCDWSLFCPAEWVTLSVESGTGNIRITLSATSTRMPRRTTVTVYSNEVEARMSEIVVEQSGVIEISTVAVPEVKNLISPDGTTAAASSSYTGISISETDHVTAGFTITPATGAAIEVVATVDRKEQTLSADLTGLTADIAYTAKAWAKLNDDDKVVSADSEPFRTEAKDAQISEVSDVKASDLRTPAGTTATLTAKFTGESLIDIYTYTAGFTLTAGGATIEIPATVDLQGLSISASAENLTPGTAYICVAWIKVGTNAPVEAASITFAPKVKVEETIIGDFTSNALWGLPSVKEDMTASSITKTDANGYTWTIFGGCLNGGALWLACKAKNNFNGYVILPRLEEMIVKSITFPNNGSGPSGAARISILVSENGGDFVLVPSCDKITLTAFPIALANQKAGSVYKIENVVDANGSTSGYSKTTKITIVAE